MSSQANTNPQAEPTMEEILASIRKIISEDQPADKTAARPAPIKAQAAPPVEAAPVRPAPAVAPAADLDVLDLTEEVPDDEPHGPVIVAARAVPPAPPPAPVVAARAA